MKDRELLLEERQYRAVVERAWLALDRYSHVELDEYVVMPNHLHGIIRIALPGGGSRAAPTPPSRPKPLSQLIGAFKIVSSKRINELRGTPGEPVWQRNYYEHVVRSGSELYKVRQYIRNNPKNWSDDSENPFRVEALTSKEDGVGAAREPPSRLREPFSR